MNFSTPPGTITPRDPLTFRFVPLDLGNVCAQHVCIQLSRLTSTHLGGVRYFEWQFYEAIATSKAVAAAGTGETYVWTTHCWMLSMYLDCPLGLGFDCPSTANISAVLDAIANDQLIWHAGSMNHQPEFMSAALLADSVALCHELDDRFNKTRKTTLSQRDVPGMTRGVVPVLAGAGVRAITVGVDGILPEVPPLFRWRDEASNTEVLGMSGPSYAPPPIVLAQHDHALLFSVRKDNSGPQTPEGVAEVFAEARLYFPNARIVSGSYDRFVASVLDNATVLASLPMVTAEIGDTWIWGTVSDPLKTARFRSFERIRSKYLINGTCSTGCDPRLRNATRFLLKVCVVDASLRASLVLLRPLAARVCGGVIE